MAAVSDAELKRLNQERKDLADTVKQMTGKDLDS